MHPHGARQPLPLGGTCWAGTGLWGQEAPGLGRHGSGSWRTQPGLWRACRQPCEEPRLVRGLSASGWCYSRRPDCGLCDVSEQEAERLWGAYHCHRKLVCRTEVVDFLSEMGNLVSHGGVGLPWVKEVWYLLKPNRSAYGCAHFFFLGVRSKVFHQIYKGVHALENLERALKPEKNGTYLGL